MTDRFEFGGYFPGAIGGVAALHGRHYVESHGLGLVFEAKVAAALADLMLRFDPAYDFFRTVRQGDRLVGSIAVEGGRMGAQARLRYFILVPEARGHGLGRRLLGEALSFCRERGFDQVYLTTLAGLNAAARLYREAGFTVTHEEYGDSWGPRLLEQRMDLHLARA
jgi:GNAT superfamily N-acetyltransferase